MRRIRDVRIEFGAAVKSRRLLLGLSQEALADLAQLDRSYIAGVERGERNVSLLAIDKIASALSMSISELTSPLRPPSRTNPKSGH
jgi:transcriptional regulator with XRE-family HTH domain